MRRHTEDDLTIGVESRVVGGHGGQGEGGMIETPLLQQVAWLSPSRWGYGAAGSPMGLDRANKPDESDWLVRASAGHYTFDFLILGLLCALAVGAGLWLTKRSATD